VSKYLAKRGYLGGFFNCLDHGAIIQPRHSMETDMDRLKKTERILRIWFLIQRSPLRYTTKDLAEKFEVTLKTIYRDLDSLGTDLMVPVYKEKTKWAIHDDYFLPPIRLTVSEALNVFLAARLMLSYSHRYDPNAESTFGLLASAVPEPLGEQIRKTVEWMRKLPASQDYLRVLARLAEAWMSRRSVKITYQALEAEQAAERTIDPYFIEPAAEGHSSYVIAYCHRSGGIRNFKIERIQDIHSTEEHYIIPKDFDANSYFSSAWGIVVEGDPKIIRLRFDPSIARIIKETAWHHSQVLKMGRDGSVTLTLRVSDTVELRSWILGWGEKVEVLGPKELRESIRDTAKAVFELYQAEMAHH